MVNKNSQYLYLNFLTTNIVIFSSQGQVVYANTTALQTLGMSLSQLKKRTFGTLFTKIITIDNQSFSPHLLPFDRVITTKKTVMNVMMTVYLKNEYISFEASLNPILNKQHQVHEVIAHFRDITKEARRVEFHRLFIKLLGHELKQPLGLIRAYLYYLKKFFSIHTYEEGKYLIKIDRQVGLLNQMLNDITDATRFNIDTFTIQPEQTDIVTLVKTTVADLRIAHPKRTIQLDFAAQHIPALKIDANRIRQALSNLVVNALKYSPRTTSVKIRVALQRQAVVIKVIDLGKGIRREELPHIFAPYYRSETDKKRGLGLGLTLVKNIIERHQGSVMVKSKAGKGTTFIISLPIR